MSSNGDHNYIGRATVIIAVFSLLAKILGLARDAVFSYKFGTSPVIDAYFAAFRVPDFVFNLLVLGTFSVAFIPIFSEYLLKDRKAADRLASSIINVTLFMMLVLIATAFIFITPLTRAIAPGFTGQAFDLTRNFTKIFLLSPLFLTLSSIVSSMLNTHKRFAIVSLSPVIYNLSIILGVLLLYPQLGPTGLAWGVVLGSFLHFAIQLPQLFRIGFDYTWRIDFKNSGFIKFWKLYWPRIFSMGTNQVTLLVATFFGSYLSAGSLSAFYYANNLQAVFLSIFAVSAALAVFPLLSDLYNQKDTESFKNVLAKTSVQILFFMIPLSVFMLIMRAQFVRLILGIGSHTNFSFADTRIVSLTLGLFAVSLFAQSLIPLFTRAFYSRQNTAVPVIIGFVTIAINLAATYYLAGRYGIPGMALAFSITSVINLMLLIMELHRQIGSIRDEYLIINSLKILMSSLIGGAICYVSLYAIAPLVNMHTYIGVFLQAAGSGLAGVIAYLAFSWLFGITEARHLMGLLRTTAYKFSRPFVFIWNNWG
ncbi:MAG: murein biosynthesis integral membrane protein MurJ [Candidatus Saccharibacteria bacterium]